jgi:Ca-activated chloride channel family protein
MLARLASVAAAMSVLAGPAPGQGQQPPQVFRSGVSTVALYASVTDRSGNPVQGLTRDHFQVFDEGERQDLTAFSSGFQPITAVLLVDTSASMALTLELARYAAEQFVIRMMPGDRARVGSFSNRVDISKSFTDNRDELLRALRDDLHIGNPTKLWDAVGLTMEALTGEPGRRVVVLFTDGDDTASQTVSHGIMARARVDELMIYAVQIRSRVAPRVEEMIIGPNNVRPRRRGDPTPTQVLRTMATETGGAHFLLNRFDDVNATFTQVASDLHRQYVLGFTPQKTDGKVHRVEVRVSEPGLDVRSRRFYQAPARGPQ